MAHLHVEASVRPPPSCEITGLAGPSDGVSKSNQGTTGTKVMSVAWSVCGSFGKESSLKAGGVGEGGSVMATSQSS